MTIALDGRLIEKARKHASDRGTTLNTLIRRLLEHEVDPGVDLAEETFRLMDEALPKSSDERWTRDELYERAR